jgi:hypothetical protein
VWTVDKVVCVRFVFPQWKLHFEGPDIVINLGRAFIYHTALCCGCSRDQ